MCAKGECFCDASLGYGGAECNEPLCANMCAGHGECLANRQCDCEEGWGGADCSDRACPINCTDHGVCAPGGFCVCLGGYTGLACERRTCENDCSGHGRCNNGTCMCAPGYTGDDCSIVLCPHDCSSRGSCVNGTCMCAPRWLGADCSVKDCEHGRYSPVKEKCVCETGFTGEWCQRNDTADSCGGCSGHGTCEVDSGLCNCLDGYTGARCAIVVCPNTCSGHGRCGSYGCTCEMGWAGITCGTAPEDEDQIGLYSVRRKEGALRKRITDAKNKDMDRLVHGPQSLSPPQI